MSDRPNRKTRRALGERGGVSKFAPDTCPACLDYKEARGQGLVDACAAVALEANILPETALLLFMNGFHDAGHKEEATPEAIAEAESPEAQAPFN